MDEPITFFNRYSGAVETEAVYGERFLRFTYGNPLGRLALHALVKRAAFSRWYGWRMDRPASRRKVLPFVERYGLDAAEFAQGAASFETFNTFFYRRLKSGARPIAPGAAVAVFPADGRHLGFADLGAAEGIFVKGELFALEELLGDADLAARFARGSLVLSRLCPVDYHRFHFPAAGTPGETVRIPGALFSVNPLALRRDIRIFCRNRRNFCLLQTAAVGTVLMMEVGATCVGGIDYTYTPGSPVEKGDEKGYFKFGGSSVLLLFEPGRVDLAPDLLEHSAAGRELYARMGDAMGEAAGGAS